MSQTSVSLAGLLLRIAKDPWAVVGSRWNRKSAVLSSVTRAWLFLAANAAAGPEAACAAMLTEFAFRAVVSGFYGALTQAFRDVEPRAVGTVAAVLVLPALGHSMEWCVHSLAGTARLAESITASVLFTAVSTSFNLFAMRRGVLIVGDRERPLSADLLALPGIVLAFAASVARPCQRLWR